MMQTNALSGKSTLQPRPSRVALMLVGGGFVMVAAAGLLLWARQSESLFASYLVSALAGCF